MNRMVATLQGKHDGIAWGHSRRAFGGTRIEVPSMIHVVIIILVNKGLTNDRVVSFLVDFVSMTISMRDLMGSLR